jgi:hypothetical protein
MRRHGHPQSGLPGKPKSIALIGASKRPGSVGTFA